MLVTINTDASFNTNHKIGAFAFWIVCDMQRIQHSGVLKDAKNPEDAELKCIINALHVLLKSQIPNVHKIIINTDSLHTIQRFNGKLGKKPEQVSTFKVLRKIIKQLKCSVEFRHVKAHIGTETKKQWVNDWCDNAAKAQLRTHIGTINKAKFDSLAEK